MEQIAENTADSLTESVKEVNQFTQYFQGKMPGLMDLGIKLVIVLIAFFVCRKIIQLILKIFGRSFERAGMEAASAHFTLSIMKAIMYVMVVAVMATFLGVSGASVAALIGSMGVGVVLALKESLSNIAGGFILLFMKPFVSGDYIHEDTHGNDPRVRQHFLAERHLFVSTGHHAFPRYFLLHHRAKHGAVKGYVQG